MKRAETILKEFINKAEARPIGDPYRVKKGDKDWNVYIDFSAMVDGKYVSLYLTSHKRFPGLKARLSFTTKEALKMGKILKEIEPNLEVICEVSKITYDIIKL